MKKYFFLTLTLLYSLTGFGQLQSPSSFLPHELGTQFTPHHMLVQYLQHVANNSDWVKLTEYGRSNQQRPLMLAHIGKPENLARLEEIRANNLRRTNVMEGPTDPTLNNIVVIWLSFGVHGNEAAGPESAMDALYKLLVHPDRDAWLDRMIICYDPTLNPDGYDRYTHWYRNVGNTDPDPDPNAREHDEPWPGGRVNHYMFDLNRDWAWQTQTESRHRMSIYNSWLPQVHVDVHEQGYNSPYYFAPAARPFHAYITDWQSTFQETIGKNHARYFDEQGWLFFTKERFDLLYPSYGDTYPTYNGAIGMTYEQGGIGAGRAVLMNNGDTLTLADRIAHHTTAILSTIEVSSQNADALIKNFSTYWQSSQANPPGTYKTFIISSDNVSGRLDAFCALLDRNGIRYGMAADNFTTRVFNYQTGKTERMEVTSSDLIISAYQPKAVLTQVLLEPETFIEDSVTYDITAWSLPYAYGLKAFASTDRIDVSKERAVVNPPFSFPQNTYAYLLQWNDLSDARFLAKAIKKGLVVRYASQPFRVENNSFDRGTLVITRADNRKHPSFDATLLALAQETNQHLQTTQTGYVEQGHDLGSSEYRLITAPNVLLLGGERTRSNSFGQAWYFFEQDIRYPVHLRDVEPFSDINLDDFNTLILVDGRYSFNESEAEQLTSWIRAGGHLIVIGSANNSVSRLDRIGLQPANRERPAQASYDQNSAPLYAEQERNSIRSYIPGAIFEVNMDYTHPLSFGIGDTYFSLKTSSGAFAPMENGYNIGRIGPSGMVTGFAGQYALDLQRNSVVFGVQPYGRGTVTYLVDNPLYRSFWEQGKFLMSNVLFFVNN